MSRTFEEVINSLGGEFEPEHGAPISTSTTPSRNQQIEPVRKAIRKLIDRDDKQAAGCPHCLFALATAFEEVIDSLGDEFEPEHGAPISTSTSRNQQTEPVRKAIRKLIDRDDRRAARCPHCLPALATAEAVGSRNSKEDHWPIPLLNPHASRSPRRRSASRGPSLDRFSSPDRSGQSPGSPTPSPYASVAEPSPAVPQEISGKTETAPDSTHRRALSKEIGLPPRYSFAITPSKGLEAAWTKILQHSPSWFAQERVKYSALYCVLRGATIDESFPTVVVKAPHHVSDELLERYKEAVVVPAVNEEGCEEPAVEFLIGSVSRLWDWDERPKNFEYKEVLEMGIGVGTEGNTDNGGTIGGYLREKSKTENVFGITAHHVVSSQKKGLTPGDAVNVENPAGCDMVDEQDAIKKGFAALESEMEMEAQEAIERDRIGVGAEASTLYEPQETRESLDRRQQILDEVKHKDKIVGTVVASSGLETRLWDQANPRDAFTPKGSHYNIDWAIFKLSGVRPATNTSPYFSSDWITDGVRVLDSAEESIPVWKVGRMTGRTAGETNGLRSQINLGDTLASVEMAAISNNINFLKPGDSGAWLLDERGKVLGLIIAGDAGESSDTAYYTPIDLLLKDVKDKAGLDLEVMLDNPRPTEQGQGGGGVQII